MDTIKENKLYLQIISDNDLRSDSVGAFRAKKPPEYCSRGYWLSCECQCYFDHYNVNSCRYRTKQL